ncbi:MAG: response regulator [Chloroflexota bacterium]|nr:response regulator [Chloroflexota bacterium]
MSEDNHNGSILVVDDEDSVRNVVAEALKRSGYAVETASNGINALLQVSKQHFDLMFLDIKMPGMSGLDVLSRIAAEHPTTTVVMLTAVDSMGAQSEARQQEAFAYLNKPCDLDEVRDIARKILCDIE